MNQTGKRITAIIITAVVVGGGIYFLQQKESSNQNPTQYTDTKSGISFTVPTGWVVSTGEEGDLYTYRENPYLTVSFKTFADKESWQKRINEWSNEITKGNTVQKDSTIGGFSAILLESKKYSAGGSSEKSLETGIYGNYYVDGGTKWFEISTADQTSAEITAIIQSIKF